MNAATGSSRGRGRTGTAFCRGTALCTASRTSRRCTPNFRATPWIVPRPNSYSRRICSNSSTVAFLRRISPLPTVHFVPRAYAAAAQGGPFPTIELGQTRVSKTRASSRPFSRGDGPPCAGGLAEELLDVPPNERPVEVSLCVLPQAWAAVPDAGRVVGVAIGACQRGDSLGEVLDLKRWWNADSGGAATAG